MSRIIRNSILISVSLVLSFGATSFSQVIAIDFDSTEPASSYTFGFAGHGDGVETTQLESDKMKTDVVASEENGNKNDEGKKTKGLSVKLNTEVFEVPATAAFDYVGWGVGIVHSLTDSPLPTNDLTKYTVKFDAKVSGTESLDQSKLRVQFVVPDGKGPEKDDDENDDVVLQMGCGEDDGTDCLTFKSEYQTFAIDGAKLKVTKGSQEKLGEYVPTNLVFHIQAQGTSSTIGKDNDNVLHIDNLRLEKKE